MDMDLLGPSGLISYFYPLQYPWRIVVSNAIVTEKLEIVIEDDNKARSKEKAPLLYHSEGAKVRR